MKNGQKVRFAESTGNDTSKIYTIAGRENHQGRRFYRLAGDKGGLYLTASLVVA